MTFLFCFEEPTVGSCIAHCTLHVARCPLPKDNGPPLSTCKGERCSGVPASIGTAICDQNQTHARAKAMLDVQWIPITSTDNVWQQFSHFQ